MPRARLLRCMLSDMKQKLSSQFHSWIYFFGAFGGDLTLFESHAWILYVSPPVYLDLDQIAGEEVGRGEASVVSGSVTYQSF